LITPATREKRMRFNRLEANIQIVVNDLAMTAPPLGKFGELAPNGFLGSDA
jgi:hypothetical protein